MRFRSAILHILLVSLIVSLAIPAHAEKRVALVIGNAAYKNAATLQNPRNDATDVSEALKRLGFETIVGFDLDKAGMEEKSIAFARDARDADVALVYYSGHAMQRRGINYLMPVDAELRDDADLRRLMRVDDIVDDLSQAKNLRILVLDSCRVNPLADELSKAMELTRGPPVDRGIARMVAPKGMIISFATQPNQTAADGQGRNSPYTMAFLKNIEAPEEIGTVFHHMTADVFNETQGKQLPELSLSVVGDFYLKGRPEAVAGVPTSDAAQAWAATQGTTSQAVLEDFIRRYGDSFYGTLARARLEEFKKEFPAKVSVKSQLPFLRGTPNSNFDYLLTIKNESGRDLTVSLWAVAPRNVETSFTEPHGSQELSSIPVHAGQSKDIKLHVRPPSLMDAGRYPVAVTVSAEDATAQTDLGLEIVGQLR
jgi:uncharacterized caspase-like protein